MAEYGLKYCQQMARARCCCQVVTASRCWWNDRLACYQPCTAQPVSHHINIFIFLQIFLRLRERSMLEEELFSLFKGNTKLLRSAAAGVAGVGMVGGGGCTVTIAIFTLCRQPPPPPPRSCSSGGSAPGAGSWDLEIRVLDIISL